MTYLPPGAAGTTEMPAGDTGRPDEILLAFRGPASQNRLTVLVRIILAIPQLVVLWVLSIAAEVVVIVCWFAALILGRLPEGMAGFLAGYLRWAARVQAYLLLLTDDYPPFELGDARYAVHVQIRPGPLNRLAVFFRFVLAIPAYIVAALVIWGMQTIVLFVTWLIVLIAGRMPRPLHEAYAAGLRYYVRFLGYVFLLTATYPGGLFGDQPGVAGPLPGMPVTAEPGEPWPAQPGYGQPAYPGPGYAMAAPGQPAYPGPGYGAAEPAYGQPEGPGEWLGGADPWRLVLSGAAKKLVAMFLVLGVILLAGYIAGIAVAASNSGNGASRANAALAVEGNYASLSASVLTFATKVSACQGKLGCVTKIDGQMSQAFSQFATQLQGISMPSPAATSAAAALQADATAAARDFHELSSATSVAQYQQLAASTGLQAQLTKFDTDHASLGSTLGVG